MKFNAPEEAFKYVYENNLVETMVTISINNNRGYSMICVPVERVYEQDGKYHVKLDDCDVDDDPRIDKDFYDIIKDDVKNVQALIFKHGDKYDITFAYDNEESLDEYIKAVLIRDMIQYLNIHTSGAFKVLEREAWEIFEKWRLENG